MQRETDSIVARFRMITLFDPLTDEVKCTPVLGVLRFVDYMPCAFIHPTTSGTDNY